MLVAISLLLLQSCEGKGLNRVCWPVLISHLSTTVQDRPVMRIHVTLLLAFAVASTHAQGDGVGDGDGKERGLTILESLGGGEQLETFGKKLLNVFNLEERNVIKEYITNSQKESKDKIEEFLTGKTISTGNVKELSEAIFLLNRLIKRYNEQFVGEEIFLGPVLRQENNMNILTKHLNTMTEAEKTQVFNILTKPRNGPRVSDFAKVDPELATEYKTYVTKINALVPKNSNDIEVSFKKVKLDYILHGLSQN